MTNLSESFYYIKDTAKITGISEQLIRQWETRYQIIKPQRLPNGYRVYSPNDLLVLKELKDLRSKGFSIKQAIQEVLIRQKSFIENRQMEQENISPYVEQLIKKGAIYDEDGLMYLLNKSNHEYGLDLFLINTVLPFLRKIGDLWGNNTWDESQEMISSLVIKDFLTQLSRNFNNGLQAPLALGFCLPHEQHEIPLQIILLQMKMKGWRTIRIGASPKLTAIEKLIQYMNPQKVLLSAITTLPFELNDNLLEQLDQMAARYPETTFYIGGQGVLAYTKIVKPKNIIISSTIEGILN